MNNSIKILFVDDDELNRATASKYIGGMLGYQITECDNAYKALEIVENQPYDLIFSDIKMPGISGIELLKRVRELPSSKNTDFVLFTGFAEVETAIKALRYGAKDYLIKPLKVEKLHELIEEKIGEINSRGDGTDEDTRSDAGLDIKSKEIKLQKGSFLEIPEAGTAGIFSKKMREVVNIAMKFHKDRSIPVLLEGESGTGKELIAKLIHHGETESEMPMITINCSAISPSLFESEVFGYEPNTFTGASKKGMAGKLELSHKGTIFLDEIGEMPMDMQPKLLRFLQDKTIYRVGGKKKIELDIRVIAATNRDLEEMVKEGAFRRDLYHRVHSGWLRIPPLREQKEAIAPLAQMFLNYYSKKRNKKFCVFSKEAVEILEEYEWPGNVRELLNTIDRIVLLNDEIEVRPQHLKILEYKDDELFADYSNVLDPFEFEIPDREFDIKEYEKRIVEKTLEKFDGNKSKTARFLGLTPSALRSRLK